MAGRLDKNKSTISRFFKAVKAKRAMPGSGCKPALTEKQNARVVTKTQEMIKVADAECDVETGPGSDRRSRSRARRSTSRSIIAMDFEFLTFGLGEAG